MVVSLGVTMEVLNKTSRELQDDVLVAYKQLRECVPHMSA
jgi:hypothetical protein